MLMNCLGRSEEAKSKSPTKLLAIVANEFGARRAAKYDFIDAWGYPFSVSEIFQQHIILERTYPGAIEDLKRVKAMASTTMWN